MNYPRLDGIVRLEHGAWDEVCYIDLSAMVLTTSLEGMEQEYLKTGFTKKSYFVNSIAFDFSPYTEYKTQRHLWSIFEQFSVLAFASVADIIVNRCFACVNYEIKIGAYYSIIDDICSALLKLQGYITFYMSRSPLKHKVLKYVYKQP